MPAKRFLHLTARDLPPNAIGQVLSGETGSEAGLGFKPVPTEPRSLYPVEFLNPNGI